MASLSIASLISFFAEEKKSTEQGENHYKSDHIEAFTYHHGVLRGEVHASMKKKVYKVTVSLHQNRAIDRYNSRSNICRYSAGIILFSHSLSQFEISK